MEYNMCLFMRSCVVLYEELTGKPLPNREVHTPFLDDETNWVEQGERGELADVALKILMKVLYGARMCRYDILRATCMLARRVSKWDKECDKRLLRLMMYIRTTSDYLTYAYVGDPPENCSIGLFADADSAGCKSTAKSTSGVVVAIVRPSTFFPLAVVSKKQDCVSTSTTEAEIVSMAMGLKQEALPTLDLWESFQGLKVFENIKFRVKSLLAFEDNQSTIVCVQEGRFKAASSLDSNPSG